MPKRGIACLFRCTDANKKDEDTVVEGQSTSSEKIEFDDPRVFVTGRTATAADLPRILPTSEGVRLSPQMPDKKSGIISTSCMMSRTQTDNAAPIQEESRKPDTGFQGLRITIQAVFDESDRKYALGLAILKRWMTEDNFVRGLYPNGRFGFRNDFQPEFNITPTVDAGLKLVRVNSTLDNMYFQLRTIEIILEQSGAADKIGE